MNRIAETAAKVVGTASECVLDLAELVAGKPGRDIAEHVVGRPGRVAVALAVLAACSENKTPPGNAQPGGTPTTPTAGAPQIPGGPAASQPAPGAINPTTGLPAPAGPTALDLVAQEISAFDAQIALVTNDPLITNKSDLLAELAAKKREAQWRQLNLQYDDLEGRMALMSPVEYVQELEKLHRVQQGFALDEQNAAPAEEKSAKEKVHLVLCKDQATDRLSALGNTPPSDPAAQVAYFRLRGEIKAELKDLTAKLEAFLARESAAAAVAQKAQEAKAAQEAAAAAAAKPVPPPDPVAVVNSTRLAMVNGLDQDTKDKYSWALRSVGPDGAWVPGTHTFTALSSIAPIEVFARGKANYNRHMPRPNGGNNRGQQYIEGYDEHVRPIFRIK